MKAWYFASQNEHLAYGDDRKIIVGKMHTVKDKPELCASGLHGSVRAIDALQYANSAVLYRVEITRNIDHGENKVCGQRRKYLARIDATEVLRLFACKQALINIEKIQPYCSKDKYSLIVKYLETGDEAIRAAARAAAGDAWAAARAAAGDAWDAARDAGTAAGDARAAAWAAARAAANTMLEQMVLEALKEQGYTE